MTAVHVRGVVLPESEERDLWIVNGRIRTEPVPGAETVVAGGFLVFTQPPAVPTTVTISVSGAGVTKSALLTVNPFPTAPMPAPTLLSPAECERIPRPVGPWIELHQPQSLKDRLRRAGCCRCPGRATAGLLLSE